MKDWLFKKKAVPRGKKRGSGWDLGWKNEGKRWGYKGKCLHPESAPRLYGGEKKRHLASRGGSSFQKKERIKEKHWAFSGPGEPACSARPREGKSPWRSPGEVKN